MFATIDKKIFIIALVVLVLIIAAGFFAYQYFVQGKKNVIPANQQQVIQQPEQNNAPANNAPIIDVPKVELKSPTSQPEGGGLMICADRCGDNICQKAGEICPENDSLNCACAETYLDCPQDCK